MNNVSSRKNIRDLSNPQEIRELNRQLDWIWHKLLGALDSKAFSHEFYGQIEKAANDSIEPVKKYIDANTQSVKEINSSIKSLERDCEVLSSHVRSLYGRKIVFNNSSFTDSENGYVSLLFDDVVIYIGGSNVVREEPTFISLIPYEYTSMPHIFMFDRNANISVSWSSFNEFSISNFSNSPCYVNWIVVGSR